MEQTFRNNIKISADAFKLIAAVAMIVDHAAFGLLHYYLTKYYMDILPQTYTNLNKLYEYSRYFGRIAFPIFCFFLVEGFIRTSNVKKYAIRLFIFALISEIPFDLSQYRIVYYSNHQNVLFTMFLGLIMLIIIRALPQIAPGISTVLNYVCTLCIVAAFCEIAFLIHCDYSYKGIILIALLYLFRTYDPFNLLIAGAFISYEKFAPISFALLYFYDNSRKPRLKYFFYLFYPAHLLLIYFVGFLLSL